MSSKVLVAVRVEADPERAFEVFTREIGRWWRPNEMFRFTPRSPGAVSFEGGEGGRFVETLPNGQIFEVGRITVWRPGERLVFGWRCAWFDEGMDTEVEVAFEPVGEGATRVTVVHSGWDRVPIANAARHGFPNTLFLQREAEWWTTLLGYFKQRAPKDPES